MYAKESERDSAKQFPEAAFCPQPARTFSFFNLKAATTKQRTRRFLRRAFHFLRRQRRGCAGNLISHLSQVNIFPELWLSRRTTRTCFFAKETLTIRCRSLWAFLWFFAFGACGCVFCTFSFCLTGRWQKIVDVYLLTLCMRKFLILSKLMKIWFSLADNLYACQYHWTNYILKKFSDLLYLLITDGLEKLRK